MNDDLNISYDFFKKMLNLVEYLEEGSIYLIELIRKLDLNDKRNPENLQNNTETLFSIKYRSRLIKEELVNTIINQHTLLINDERLRNRFQEMTEDFEKIYTVWDQISNSSYYIDEQGILINKGAAQNEQRNSKER